MRNSFFIKKTGKCVRLKFSDVKKKTDEKKTRKNEEKSRKNRIFFLIQTIPFFHMRSLDSFTELSFEYNHLKIVPCVSLIWTSMSRDDEAETLNYVFALRGHSNNT